MKLRTFTLTALFAMSVFVVNIAAQKASKPLVTDYPPYLCVGGGFVAIVGSNTPLALIRIDEKGIERPETIPVTYNDIRGVQCGGSQLELLDRGEGASGHFSTILLSVGKETIHQEQREDLGWSGYGPTSPTVAYKVGSLESAGSQAGMTGDWYVEMPWAADRAHNKYEVHFVSSNTPYSSKLVVTLLEETLDKKKITASLLLVHIEADHD
jgi:hypothetical protein